MARLRRPAVVAVVALATLAAGVGAMAVFKLDRDLDVGRISLSVQPGHRGALDVYVPLVDWGARFEGVRLPVRLSIDVRTVDRAAARRVAAGELPDVEAVRDDAADAIASYIRLLVLVVLCVAFAAGALVAFAVRAPSAPRLRYLVGTAGATALLFAVAVALLLPPRGEIGDPEYYANGPDIPVALRAVEQATSSAETLSEELNEQLVGLARLVSLPSDRPELDPLPRLTLASDLHNNVLALPTLERAVRTGPLMFVGDLTSSGTPFESRLTRRIVDIGDPFVFVSGNHDSDSLIRDLVSAGAVVLTERGRLLPGGRLGPVVVRVGGIRVAGYADPFERRRSQGYRQQTEPRPTPEQQRAFADWLNRLRGKVDAVLVHEPQLADVAVGELIRRPPREPLAILSGHTHKSFLFTERNMLELNGGTAGGGGTGNLEKNQPFGVAVLTYERRPFRPVAADLVEIDARDGSAFAKRTRLDVARERVRRDVDRNEVEPPEPPE